MQTQEILRISKRLRNLHRALGRETGGGGGVSLKEFARRRAANATAEERRADPEALDRVQRLTTPALAWHWLAIRGMAPS